MKTQAAKTRTADHLLPGQRTTRRRFLQATAAAAVATATIVPRHVLGGAAGPPPSEILGGALIGCGGQGGGDFESLGRGVRRLATCDVKFKGKADDKTTYTDFRKVLERKDIDVVVIATPDHWHALISIAAAKAGKDIYCEKPLSLTIREARAMVTTVRRYGRVLQTGSQQRSSHEFRFACEMVRSGRIGQLKSIHVMVGGPSVECSEPAEPEPANVDWDMWLGPAPWRPYSKTVLGNWRPFIDYSGGQMTDWGAHHFDIAQWALDADNSGPLEIIPPGPDSEHLTYVYANGVKVCHNPRAGAGVVFHGSEGTIMVDRGLLKTEPASIMRKPIGSNEVHLYDATRQGHGGNFIHCVRTRERPICDVEIGCRSVTVCHLGNIAYRLRRPLKWDPVKEEFPGDEEANRFLDRAKREPWTL
jgi:predicted dehydrogenase